jgi:Zn-dependent peptidase ImmA (M78 family)
MISSVKIGPQVFDVEFRNTREDGMLNDNSYGYTLDQGNLIVIASDVSESKQKVTMVHEILHSARMIMEGATKPKKKAEYDEWEHHFIGIFENAFIVILQDNPELVKWLTKQ